MTEAFKSATAGEPGWSPEPPSHADWQRWGLDPSWSRFVDVPSHAGGSHAAGFPDDYGQAITCAAAEHAYGAIFSYLNTASTWGKVPLSQAQIHNDPSYDKPAELFSVKPAELFSVKS